MEKVLQELSKAGCDIVTGLRRFVNNENLYLKFLYKFPSDKTLSNFEIALRCQDYEFAKNELHTFKGISGNLGFSVLYDISAEILKMINSQQYDMATACTKILLERTSEIVNIIELNKKL
ncbi:MAG: Hpt domain-containing protein [Clostridia bacterium]